MAKSPSTLVQVHVARPRADGSWEHLVLLRSHHQDEYPGIWQVITGRGIGHERAPETALREVEEESSLHVERLWILPQVASFYSLHTDSIHHIPVFGCQVAPICEVRLSGEHSEYRWLSALSASEILVVPAQKDGVVLFDTLLHNLADSGSFNSIYEIDV